jgi:S-adenosylmethionine:tRNA ribosyltransferase-isomerase
MNDLDAVDAYDFTLPDASIATEPARPRSSARMLALAPDGRVDDRVVGELPQLLGPDDLLVVNDAQVTPARLRGRRATGGAVELFVLGFGAEGVWSDPALPAVCAVRSNRGVDVGEHVLLTSGEVATVESSIGGGVYLVGFDTGDVPALLERSGELPLPPYIVKRRQALGAAAASARDQSDYQTRFAREPGAVAAPTAGLHFDDALLEAVRAAGIGIAHVTLRVGLGTFAPVRVERMSDHDLHAEHYHVPESTAEAIMRTRRAGGRVVAVGTTTVRTLESAWDGATVRTGDGSTRLFIRPGYSFGVVDALLTNFHLPRSSLLALVCAFGGYEAVMSAYRHAVEAGYRFYSYGDAMFIGEVATAVEAATEVNP